MPCHEYERFKMVWVIQRYHWWCVKGTRTICHVKNGTHSIGRGISPHRLSWNGFSKLQKTMWSSVAFSCGHAYSPACFHNLQWALFKHRSFHGGRQSIFTCWMVHHYTGYASSTRDSKTSLIQPIGRPLTPNSGSSLRRFHIPNSKFFLNPEPCLQFPSHIPKVPL